MKKGPRLLPQAPEKKTIVSSSPSRTRTYNKPVTRTSAFPRSVDYLIIPEGCGALAAGLWDGLRTS